MTTPTEQQMREDNLWLEKHVIGYDRKMCPSHHSLYCCGRQDAFSPSTNKAHAFTVLEKCAQKALAESNYFLCLWGNGITCLDQFGKRTKYKMTSGATLETSIVAFAKELFK